jgi:hypothetical protein
MALECSLILSGNPSPEALIYRLFPEAAKRPDFEVCGGVWVVDLRVRMGFVLRLHQGTQGYFEAEAGGDIWTWEPDAYLNLGFGFDKEFPRSTAHRHMLKMIARLLTTGHEDVALIQNGNELLLHREAGKLTRFPAQGFWESLEPADVPEVLKPESWVGAHKG